MKWLLALVALAVAAALGAGAWLVGTESGLRWALRHAPQDLTVEGAATRKPPRASWSIAT